MEYGLYIHIPYCASRCRYCDFYTRPGSRGVPEEYIDALLRDFFVYAPKGPKGAPLAPATVYLGGGTPGLLAPAQVTRLLEAVRPMPGAEITLEANPGSVGKAEMEGWRQAGVNRLSLGVQTARGDSLRRLGRPHTAADAARALQDARAAGFENISGDIMLALPGYSEEEFDETLSLLEEGGAVHVSAYLLKIEPDTAFGRQPPAGLPDGDAAAAFYLYAARQLALRGYARYEISNFAKPGYASAHNQIYWDAGAWLGLGPAAHSCLEGMRFSFPADLDAFLANRALPQEEGVMTADDYLMLRLRLDGGLDERVLAQRYGASFSARQRKLLEKLAGRGLAVWENGRLRLTGEGMLVQNTILAGLGNLT